MLQTALVTGANGFVGRHLVTRLTAEGWRVVRLVRDPPFDPEPDTIALGGAPWSVAAIAGALESSRPDTVFHLVGSPWASSTAELYELNFMAAVRLFEAIATRSPASAVVLIGSAAEYGFVPEDSQPVTEDFPCTPMTHYAIAKYAQTQLGLAWARAGMPVMIARLFNPVGPDMPRQLALAEFVRQIHDETSALLVGNLDVARDFLHVTEAARIIVGLASDRKNFGQVINVCSGVAICLRRVVEELTRLADRPITITTDPSRLRTGEMRSLRGDATRLRGAGLEVDPPDPSRLAMELLRSTAIELPT